MKDYFPFEIRAEKFCRSLIVAGYNVNILCRWNGEDVREELFEKIKVSRAGYQKNNKLYLPASINPLWQNEIKKAFENIKPSLIIVREFHLAEAAAKYARMFDIPVIMDMAENYPAAIKEFKRYRKNLLSRMAVFYLNLPEYLEKRCVPKMNGITTVCNEQVGRLRDSYGYNPGDTAVIHNTPEKNYSLIKILKQHENKITFCHHGYMTAEKGLTNFVEGFILASQSDSRIELVLAGSGECFEEIFTLVQIHGVRDKIHLLGKYNHADLPEILSNIDIGVLPYQLNDFNNFTIHNKIFDFFSAGKPILSSLMIPATRLLNETKAGKSYDMSSPEKIAQAILSFINSDLDFYSRNSLKAFEKYNWGNDSKELINFIGKYI